MKALGCTEFESELAELLASPDGAASEEWDDLRHHAASCDRCRGAAELLDLAKRPAALRDPIPDPGPAYWRSFETSLAARIAAERARPGGRARAVWGVAGLIAAAVAALVLLVPRRAPLEEARIASAPPPAPSVPAPPLVPAAPPGAAAPPERVRSETPPAPAGASAAGGEEDDLAEGFPLGGPTDPFAEPDEVPLFPSVDELTDEERGRLADWLAQEEERVRRGAA